MRYTDYYYYYYYYYYGLAVLSLLNNTAADSLTTNDDAQEVYYDKYGFKKEQNMKLKTLLPKHLLFHHNSL